MTISVAEVLFGAGAKGLITKEWLPSLSAYPTDTTEGIIWIAQDVGSVGLESFIVGDSVHYVNGSWLRFGSSGSPFPADSTGHLSNDGYGVLSWDPEFSLPVDASGVLTNDGYGVLSWGLGGDVTATGINNFTGGGSIPATYGSITIDFGGTISSGSNLVGTNTSYYTYIYFSSDEGYIGKMSFYNTEGTKTFDDLINEMNSFVYGLGSFSIVGGNIVGTTSDTGSTRFIQAYGSGSEPIYGGWPVFSSDYGYGADGWVSNGTPVYGTDAIPTPGNTFTNPITIQSKYPLLMDANYNDSVIPTGKHIMYKNESGSMGWKYDPSINDPILVVSSFNQDIIVSNPSYRKVKLVGTGITINFYAGAALDDSSIPVGTTIEVYVDKGSNFSITTNDAGYSPSETMVIDTAGSGISNGTTYYEGYYKFTKIGAPYPSAYPTNYPRWQLSR